MIELDTKTAQFEVSGEGPAEFTVTNLRIVPTEVLLGGVVNIYATVTNIGGLPGSKTVYITGDITGHRTTGVLNPGQSEEVNHYQRMVIAGIYNISVDGLTGSFIVIEELQPAGSILDFLVLIDGEWQDITGLELGVDQTISIAVGWMSDMAPGGPNMRGRIHLWAVRPNHTELVLTPTSGQDSIVAPGDVGVVVYEDGLTLDQGGAWYLGAKLDGEIV